MALKGAVADLLDLQADETEDTGLAKAADLKSQGDLGEATAYGNAADVAENNATLAGIAGEIKEYQTTRDVYKTVGSQRAAIAASGFGDSGTSLALARSSFQQGYLDNQLTRTQTLSKQGGYLEEAAAAKAEAAAATTASDAALVEKDAYTTSASKAKTRSTTLANSITDYLKVTDPDTLTAEDKLATAELKDNPDSELSSAVSSLKWYTKKDGTAAYGTGDETKDTTTTTTTTTEASGSYFNGKTWVTGARKVDKYPGTVNLFGVDTSK